MSYAKKVEALSNLFEDLEGVAGAVSPTGAPLEIALDLIEEDPDQPRRRFRQAELEELAASIRERGVRQAITVTPKGEGGRHRILYGARRFRAARLAGLATIPAVVREPSAQDAYDQMIENIQREDLTAAEIASFVLKRLDAGEKQADIARLLGKDRPFVALYAAVGQMPDPLRAKLDTSPVRAVYDLYQAWRQHPDEVLAFCRERESFTRADALAFVRSLREPSPSAMEAPSPTVTPVGRSEIPSAPRETGGMVPEAPATPRPGEARTPAAAPATERRPPSALPRISVVVAGRPGLLVLDEAAPRGSGYALVRFDDGAVDEVTVGRLRVAAVAPGNASR